MGRMINLNEATIAESGSNSNGKYIKFSDGTMICWYDQAFTGLTNADYSVQGLTVKRTTLTWTFPQAFVSAPTVSANSGRLYSAGAALGGALPSIYSANTSTTSTVVVIEALVAYDEVREHGLVAIGKWK